MFEWFGVREITDNLPTNTYSKLLESLRKTLFHKPIGWAAIHGRIGSGKTTSTYDALRELSREFPIEVVELKVLNRKSIKVHHLLNAFIHTLGKKYDNSSRVTRHIDGRTLQVERILMKMHQANVLPVLVIDEAHELESLALNMIKRLRDVTFIKKAVMLPVILIGQPSLPRLLEHNDEVKDRITHWKEYNYSKKELVAIAQYRSHRLLSEETARQVVDLYTETKNAQELLPTPLKLDSKIREAMSRAFDIESKSISIKNFVPPPTKELPKSAPRKKISIVGSDIDGTITEINEKAAS